MTTTLSAEELARLKQHIWSPGAVRPVGVFGLFDCARDPAVHPLIAKSYRDRSCLFAGDLDPELERAAPFLLELSSRDGVTDHLLRHGWPNAWGLLLRSGSSFRSVRRHLRTLLRVRTEDHRFLLFRFYDPRVLGTYLPTCRSDELNTVFGDIVDDFIVPAQDRAATDRLSVSEGQLVAEQLM